MKQTALNSNMENNKLTLLKAELDLLERAAKTLRYSQKRCLLLGKKEVYSLKEEERFESLTARFARICDILVQKVFRLIDAIDLEDQGTVLDRIHRAEKKGLIESAGRLIEMRELRNRIAHDYSPKAVAHIFHEVLEHTPHLLNSVAHTQKHAQKYFE